LENTIENIIKQAAEKLVAEMQSKVPRVTGKTAESIEAVVTPNSLTILGGKQIGAIINGRGPTKPNAPKGNPTLQQSILSWLQAASITPREAGMSQESLSWAISKSIHKNGYKGKGDIFKDVLTENKIADITGLVLNAKLTEAINLINKIKTD